MRSSLSIAVFFALHAVLPTSLALGNDVEGGVLRVSTNRDAVPDTLLEPMTSSPITDTSGEGLQRREPSIIGGLLQIRQSCPTGYGLCDNGKCCPLGGRCCTAGCCDAGYWCYSTGCCRTTETGCEGVSCCPVGANCCKGGGCCESNQYCTAVNGVRGCCAKGKICTGGVRECNDPGYEVCPNDNFCCPPGYTCYRDSSNAARCREGSSGGGGGGGGNATPSTTSNSTPSILTTPRSTTIASNPTASSNPTTSPNPPDLPQTTVPPSSPSSTPSSMTPTPPRPTSRPTVGPNMISYSIQANDNRIIWRGNGWSAGKPSCTSNSRRTNTPGQSFTLMVPSASKIYLNLDHLNVVYDVYTDGQMKTFTSDASDNAQTCVYHETPLNTNTDNVNLTVAVIGMSKDGETTDWEFQLNEIMVVDAASNSISSSSVIAPAQTAAGSVSGTTGKLDTTCFRSLVAVFLAGFGLALW